MAKDTPTLEKYTFDYWTEQLEGSKEERAAFEEAARKSVRSYKKDLGEVDDVSRTVQIWWSTVSTLLPAYFSRLPKVDVSLRHATDDILPQLAGQALEQSAQYCIEEHFDFKGEAINFVMQYILTGEGALWARYEPALADEQVKYALNDGEEYDGDGEIFEEEGRRYVNETISKITDEKAVLESVHFTDYRESPARKESEITWRARRAYLTREKAVSLFGDAAEEFNYSCKSEHEKLKSQKTKREFEGKAEVWEIHCKETKKIYFLHPENKEFLEVIDPPIDYPNFFPCVVLKANIEPGSATATSDYKECEDIILEIERCTTRMHACLQSIKVNFAYNEALGDKITSLFSDEFKGVPVSLSAHMSAKGGLEQAIKFIDISTYVNALEVLAQSRERALQRLAEACGVSDLLRGQTVALKTATANMLESSYASLKFSVRREQVAKALTDGIKLVSHIITQKFEGSTIFKMCDAITLASQLPDPVVQVDPMQPPQPMPVPPEQKFEAILALLQDAALSNYKLDVESDSLIELDQMSERQDRIDAMSSIGQFLQQLYPMIQQAPATATFAQSMLKFVIRTYKAGKEVEQDFMGAFGAMVSQLQTQQQQQPDPVAMQAEQNRVMIAQLQEETKRMVAQWQAQLKQAELSLAAQKNAAEVQNMSQDNYSKMIQLEFEREAKLQDLAYRGLAENLSAEEKREKLALEWAKLGKEKEKDAVMMQLKGIQEAFDQRIEEAYLKLDKLAIVAKENEKLIEEQRLARQERLDTFKVISDQIASLKTAEAIGDVSMSPQTGKVVKKKRSKTSRGALVDKPERV